MLTHTRVTRWVPVLAGALFLGGCQPAAGPTMATLTVRLTDAPFPLDSVARVDVFIVRVEVQPADSDSTHSADSTSTDSTGAGLITVATPNQRFNLLDLQHGTTVDLGGTTVPTGAYHGVRLILNTDSSSVTLKNGMVLNGNSRPGIMWPSAGQSGIKVILDQPVNVVAGGTVMVLDFDLGNSFVVRGRTITQNGLLFKPVVRGSAQGA